MVVIGGIIGAGIFVNPYIVGARLDTPPLVLGAWVAAAPSRWPAPSAYAELGAVFPRPAGSTSTFATACIRSPASSTAGRCCW